MMRGDTSFKVDNAWANDGYINATLHAAAGLVDSLSKHIAVAKPLREAQDKMAGRGSSLRGGYTARQASGHEEVTLYVAADAPNQAMRLNRLAREQSLSTGSRTTHKLVFQQIDADTAHVESEHTSVDDFVMTHAQVRCARKGCGQRCTPWPTWLTVSMPCPARPTDALRRLGVRKLGVCSGSSELGRHAGALSGAEGVLHRLTYAERRA